MDDRTLRIAIVVIGHLMWLSTAAIRTFRNGRGLGSSPGAHWSIALYPYLVWVPLVLATFFGTGQVDLAPGWQVAGVAVALAGSLVAAWSMWTVRRYPKYLGIVDYHVGAALALESIALIAATAVLVVPYTLARIAAEDRKR